MKKRHIHSVGGFTLLWNETKGNTNWPPRKPPRNARVIPAEELGTVSKNNFRRITLVWGPIYEGFTLTLIISWFKPIRIWENLVVYYNICWVLAYGRLNWQRKFQTSTSSRIGCGPLKEVPNKVISFGNFWYFWKTSRSGEVVAPGGSAV